MLNRKWIAVVVCLVVVVSLIGTASAETKRCQIVKGTAVVDGEIDSVWASAKYIGDFATDTCPAKAKVRTLWDNDYFYVLFEVEDAVLSAASGSDAHEQDSVEVFFDPENSKAESWPTPVALIAQYRVNIDNKTTGAGDSADYPATTAVKKTSNGYIAEMAIPWFGIEPKVGAVIGVDFQVNDDADGGGKRTGQLTWNDTTNNSWRYANVFGEGELLDAPASPATADSMDILLYAVVLLAVGGLMFVVARKRAFSKS